MKSVCLIVLFLLMSISVAGYAQTALVMPAAPVAPDITISHKIHHVVIIWLKQPGNEEARQQYIDASLPLAKIPGVLSYTVGAPARIKHERENPALDESYDVAVSSFFASEQAYEAFLKNPLYLKLAQQLLRPLVDKYKVYDFVE